MTGRLAARLVRLAGEAEPPAPTAGWRDPAARDAHPGRARLDGRLHPPEREQAARPVRRRRPDPARPGRDRRSLDLAGLVAGRRAAERLSPASRRAASSRTAAAARAARERPIAPVRKTTRRTCRSPVGVATAIETAVSPAARPGPDRQADLRAAELAGPPREADEVVGRCLVGRSGASASAAVLGPVGGRGRRLGGDRLVEAEPGSVAEQGAERCRPSRSRRPPASSRARRAARRWPRSRSSRRSPRRSRRAWPSTTAAAGFDQRRRPTSPSADGRDPDVDRLGPGVGRDDRVGRPQHRLAEQLGDLRLADPGQPVGPRGDRRARGRAPASRGHDLVGPHRAHLARRTGQGDDHPAVGPRRRTSRARSRSGWRATSADGISQACLRLSSGNGIPRRAHSSRSHASRSGSTAGRLAADRGDRLAGQVVGGRAEAAGRDDEVGPVEGRPRRPSVTVARSSGQRRQPAHPDAQRRSASGRARRRSCRACRRRSARCRCSAARRSAGVAGSGAAIAGSVARRVDRRPAGARCAGIIAR